MAITKSEIEVSSSAADRRSADRTHRKIQLKKEGIFCPTDDTTEKNKMLENILRKYRSAWKKLARL